MSYYEHFLSEIQRKLDLEEISPEKAQKWCEQVKDLLAALPSENPLGIMPVGN